MLDILEKLSKPDINALLHEFGFQLLFELCSDPLTGGPTMDILSNKKYQCFVKHLETIGVAPLPKRNSTQALRISSLHQRAWLLKLLSIELHTADMANSSHREACHNILAHLFGQDVIEYGTVSNIPQSFLLQNSADIMGTGTISKSKNIENFQPALFQRCCCCWFFLFSLAAGVFCFLQMKKRKEKSQVTHERKKQLMKLRLKAEKVAACLVEVVFQERPKGFPFNS